MKDAESFELIQFAKAWSDLGCMITNQVEELLNDISGASEEVNPNAIKTAKESLGGMNEEIDQIFSEYFEWLEKNEMEEEE